MITLVGGTDDYSTPNPVITVTTVSGVSINLIKPCTKKGHLEMQTSLITNVVKIKTSLLRRKWVWFLFYFISYLDCEHLIRHMLVRDLSKRYTMANIMNHKWVNELDEEDKANVFISDSSNSELSEEVLNMMLARGIDRDKTIQVGVKLVMKKCCLKNQMLK